MTILNHIPDQFEFEYQGGTFSAKKSFWQNTLDKSCVAYVIELEGFGEYGEVKIAVDNDDWVDAAIEAVKENTKKLAMAAFIDPDTVSPETTDTPVELGDEEDAVNDAIVASEPTALPFPAVTEDIENMENEGTDEDSQGDAAAVEAVDISQSNHLVHNENEAPEGLDLTVEPVSYDTTLPAASFLVRTDS